MRLPCVPPTCLQEVKQGDAQRIRALFERATHLQLPPKKMKQLFKRWVDEGGVGQAGVGREGHTGSLWLLNKKMQQLGGGGWRGSRGNSGEDVGSACGC